MVLQYGVTGDISALYLAMDWMKILVQHLSSNTDRRSSLAEHLESMCSILQCATRWLADKRSLVWSIGACFFAMRQLGCSAAVISWMQDHAQVTLLAHMLSRGDLSLLFCEDLY